MELKQGIPLLVLILIVGGILFAYYKNLIPFLSKAKEVPLAEKCNNSDFSIYNCTYNGTSNELSFSLQNNGSYDIENFNVIVSYEENVSKRISILDTLPNDTIKAYDLNNIDPSFVKISIYPEKCTNLIREVSCK